MSKGGGGAPSTTTQTTSTKPWSAQQGYLKDIFARAQQQYQTSSEQPTYISPLYQSYIEAAQQQAQGGLPGGAALTGALNQALGASTIMNPFIQALQATGGGAQTQAEIEALKAAGQGENAALPGLMQAGSSQWAAPWQAALAGQAGQSNPFIEGTAASSALAMANPALAGLQQAASGQFLTPDTNPYLQQAVQNAMDAARGNIASQFNQGGRYGSGAMADVMSKQLGNIATNAYAGAYENERARQLAAQQALGGQWLQGVGQLASGQQAAGGMLQGQQGLAQQALQAAAGLGGQQQQLQQQALGQAGELSGADLARQLQAQQGALQGTLQSQQQNLSSQQAAANAAMQALGLQANAINVAPTIQGMSDAQLAQLANAAQIQQQIQQLPEQQAWDQLANYLALVQGSYGGTSTAQVPYMPQSGGSTLGTALGAGLGAATLAMPFLFSSRTLKTRLRAVNQETIVKALETLPMQHWSYIGSPQTHIGPMAEDFAEAFGTGDDLTIAPIDVFGVLLTSMKWLIAENKALTSRIAALENTNGL